MTAIDTRTDPRKPVNQTLFRGAPAPVTRAESVRVSKDGGNERAGILEGVSLIAKGEALGHDVWIDDETLRQVSAFANQGNHGVKSRFTHPSMSADGLGRHLGRLRDVRTIDNQVVGDLHFAKSAHNTPEGNLADYVMELAAEDSAAAGLSIVFEHDRESETAFLLEHGAVVLDSGWVDLDGFQSPDPDNTQNLPHVRVGKLRAADVVDEPAANPDGFFDRSPLPRDADALLSYAAGLSDEKPQCLAFGVDADRATQFLTRWLNQHGLTLTHKEETEPMAEQQNDTTPAEPSAPSATREDVIAELEKYTTRFGAENGQQWFAAGVSFSEALESHCELLEGRIEHLQEQLRDAEQKLETVNFGEEPIDTGVQDESQPKKPRTLGEALMTSGREFPHN